MAHLPRQVLFGLLLIALCTACAPTSAPVTTGQAAQPVEAPHGVKRITTSVTSDPPALYYAAIPAPVRPEIGGVLSDFLHPGLTTIDQAGTLHAVLAESVPTLDNGQWTLTANGHMATTWTIRSGASWHDGTPLSADDLVFTVDVVRDKELAALRNKNYDLIDSVTALDDRTVTIQWRQPYIDADQMFSVQLAQPLPQHLLSGPYAENKSAFMDLPYWNREFVGTGPFRLKQWEQGSQLTLEAYDAFVLGRPRIDEIDVKFIPDGNTLVANILSGTIDLTLGKLLSLDQVLQVRDQWKDGKVVVVPDAWVVVYPQFVNPTPPIVLNPSFRQALLLAMDRQQMADEIMDGLVPIAESVFNPGTPDYLRTQSGIVHYDYDPRKATGLIEGLGYARGADGVLRDAAGQKLSLETRAAASYDIHVKTLFPVVDAWQQIGIDAQPVGIPAQHASDLEEQATFPAFQVLWQPNGRARLVALHSSEARLPERNYTGSNNGRYMNPDFDRLIDQYQVTIPIDARMDVATQIVHHMTEQLPVMGLFYNVLPSVVSSRLHGVSDPTGTEGARQGWNAQAWTVD